MLNTLPPKVGIDEWLIWVLIGALCATKRSSHQRIKDLNVKWLMAMAYVAPKLDMPKTQEGINHQRLKTGREQRLLLG